MERKEKAGGSIMTEEKILREGPRLLLRKAEPDDLGYILELEYDKENRQFIVPFDESFHRPTIAGRTPGAMDVIAIEKQTGERAGYFLLNGLMEQPSDEIATAVEWTHIIIARKGKGYGHEALKLLKALCVRDAQVPPCLAGLQDVQCARASSLRERGADPRGAGARGHLECRQGL
jgi:hypothetical protein